MIKFIIVYIFLFYTSFSLSQECDDSKGIESYLAFNQFAVVQDAEEIEWFTILKMAGMRFVHNPNLNKIRKLYAYTKSEIIEKIDKECSVLDSGMTNIHGLVVVADHEGYMFTDHSFVNVCDLRQDMKKYFDQDGVNDQDGQICWKTVADERLRHIVNKVNQESGPNRYLFITAESLKGISPAKRFYAECKDSILSSGNAGQFLCTTKPARF